MSSFMTGGFTELLKLDLEPWKVDNVFGTAAAGSHGMNQGQHDLRIKCLQTFWQRGDLWRSLVGEQQYN